MTTRMKTFFAGLLGDTPDREVHFHAGPDALPAVCFDGRCDNPRLEL